MTVIKGAYHPHTVRPSDPELGKRVLNQLQETNLTMSALDL